jgi:hypothetical protein
MGNNNTHFPWFDDTRSIQFAMSIDGVNPFSNQSSTDSTLPVVLSLYNLPPWLCKKQKYILSGTALGVPLNNWKPPLKTRNRAKAKHASLNHAGHGPRRGDPNGPPRRPTRRSPRAGFASLEDARLPRAGSAPFEGVCLPRAGSTSLEGPLRPRAGLALLEGAPHARACSRTRAFNALTTAGRRHHAPGARTPVPPHQLPRREPIPATVGGLCGVAGASPVTPRRLLR